MSTVAFVDDVVLTAETAVLASRIRTIDRDLDALERDVVEMVKTGLRATSPLAGVSAQRADERHDALLAERAELVARLKTAVAAQDRADG